MIKAGDVGFVRGGSLLSRGIRWFEREPGEAPTWTNHALTFTTDGNLYTVRCIEAQWRVQDVVWYEAHGGEKCELEVWRHNFQTPSEIEREVEWLKRQVGHKYGWWKLLTIAGKRVTGLPFDRLHFIKGRPICSVLTALGKDRSHIYMGDDPMRCTPDTMHDWLKESPKAWRRVLKVRLNGGIE